MAQGLKCWGWGLGLVGALALSALWEDRTLAQSNIVPDDTLGAENSVVIPNFNGLPVEVIQGGAQRGQNLFHSFEEFNIDADRGAYFFSPADIQNILARVTGSNRSEILGTLGTFGNSTPNLFLINPNGILFGEGAKLDVGGSFVATTANAVGLGEIGLFSASQPETSTLLAINPNAFFFNQLSNQAEIVNRSTATTPVLDDFVNPLPFLSGLQVPKGRSLLLLGGDVRLEGGVLRTPGGRVELGGLSAAGTVGLNLEGNTLSLSFPNEVARADVWLTNRARVDAAAGGGGSIAINAQKVELLEGSIIFTGIASGQGSVDSQAGDIEIKATGAITVSELSAIGNQVLGIGKGGDIEITTHSLSLTDGAFVSASTFGRGDAGSVRITASDTVAFAGVGSDGRSSSAFSQVRPGTQGNGGDLEITTKSLFVTDGAQLSAITLGRGNAGNVRIRATDTVAFAGVGSNGLSSGAFSQVLQGAEGKGGDVEIITNSLSVTDGAFVSASTFGRGDAGSVKITASDTVAFAGVGSNGRSSSAFSQVRPGAQGNGGDIEVTTKSLFVTDGAQLSASTSGRGNAGNVSIRAIDTVAFAGVGSNGLPSGAFSTVEEGGEGKGGNVEITTNSLSVTDGAQLVANTGGWGDAGNVTIRATDTVSFSGVGSNGLSSGASSQVVQGAEGKGGDVEIITNSLSITDGAFLSASTRGRGDAGNVKITASDTVAFAGVGSNGLSSGARSMVIQGAQGDGGNVEISTNSLSVTDGAELAASTFGQGVAGNVKITATNTVSFAGVGSNGDSSGAFSTVGQGGEGNGGNVEITTNSLSVTDGAQLGASTLGRGDAGNVKITATNTVSFAGVGNNGFSSVAGSTVEQGAEGKGGNVEITTNSLSVTDGAQLGASTRGRGDAGNVRITATNTVSFAGVGSDGSSSGATSQVASGAVGNGGNIEITTNSLSVTDGAQLVANTFGRGNAGSVKITASDTVSFAGVSSNNSGAFSSVAPGAEGNGGDVEITTNSLFVTDGTQLVAATFGRGDAGNVRITATDMVSFAGVGINGFSSAAGSSVQPGAKGNGGDIEITARSLSLTDAFISSESRGTGRAGDIIIQTRQNLELDRSRIRATTQSGDGGNITLRVGDLLLLRDRSLISTTAGEAGTGGDGGNITIDADFIVAVPKENSDITANAFEGRGGNINIKTQGIYGLEFREELTPLSDITASSRIGVDGEFQLDLLTNVDPSRGLVELPTDVVDASEQIDRRCTPAGRTQQGSSFTVTGRGGLPPSPNDPLQGESMITNWASLDSDEENHTSPATTTPKSSVPRQFVEAQGWYFNEKGEVVLTASAPEVTPQEQWFDPAECQAFQSSEEDLSYEPGTSIPVG
ncbi:MAG TPA: filamentous hemagglutinin N-terminal domain-containing protein [Coleofasciculaceae cyanobacterium]